MPTSTTMMLTIQTLLLMMFEVYVDCQTGRDAKNLTTFLFSDYDKRIRPTDIQTDPIDISISFYLFTLNEVDEVSETMTTTGYLNVEWTDEYLAWDPLDYGGLKQHHWPQGTLWKPDISLRNSINEYKELGIPTLNVVVQYDGSVSWRPFEVFRSTCSMDIKYFPFDVQTCYLTFGAWSYLSTEIQMKVGVHGFDLHQFEESSLWKIVHTDVSVIEEYEELSIRFEICVKRKPMFYLLNIILPIVLLAILNVSVFVLPCESGERAGFAVTMFLALAVFLTVVSDTLPTNSETVAVFSVYLIIQTVQSTLITLVTMVTIRWSQYDDDVPVYACLVTLVRLTRWRGCNIAKKGTKVQSVSNADSTNRKDDAVVAFTKRTTAPIGDDQVRNNNTETPSSSPRTDAHYHHGDAKPTWQEAVRALDAVLFILFALLFIVSTIVCVAICSVGA